MTTRACPSCAGGWLYALTLDHSNDCPLRAADDATVAADYEKAAIFGQVYRRESTDTEAVLAAALGRPPYAGTPAPPSFTQVIAETTSVRARRLSYGPDGPWFNPDDSPEAAA